jgi:16S rRNA processing protein RimM
MRIRFTGARRGDLVEVGRIVKPQGVKGELKIIPFAGGGDFPADSELFLLDDSGRAQFLSSAGRPGPGRGASLPGWPGSMTVIGPRALRGLVVAVALADLPPLAADEIYWHQLEGLPARTAMAGKSARCGTSCSPGPGRSW